MKTNTIFLIILLYAFLSCAKKNISDKTDIPEGYPEITHHGFLSDSVLTITIHSGKTIPKGIHKLDESTKIAKDGETKKVIDADTNFIGIVIGPKQDHWKEYEQFKGKDIDLSLADSPGSYILNEVHPVSVSRVSKPRNIAKTGGWEFKFPMEHTSS